MIAVIFLLGLALTVLVLLLMEVRRLNRRDQIINVFVAGHQVHGRRAPWADDAVRRQELARQQAQARQAARNGSGR